MAYKKQYSADEPAPLPWGPRHMPAYWAKVFGRVFGKPPLLSKRERLRKRWEQVTRCHDKGIIVTFATARPIRTVAAMNLLIRKDAAIYHNGAVIAIGEKIHSHIGIEPKTTNRLLAQAASQFAALNIAVEIDDALNANFDVTRVWTYTTAVLTDFTDLPDKPADKIISAQQRIKRSTK